MTEYNYHHDRQNTKHILETTGRQKSGSLTQMLFATIALQSQQKEKKEVKGRESPEKWIVQTTVDTQQQMGPSAPHCTVHQQSKCWTQSSAQLQVWLTLHPASLSHYWSGKEGRRERRDTLMNDTWTLQSKAQRVHWSHQHTCLPCTIMECLWNLRHRGSN